MESLEIFLVFSWSGEKFIWQSNKHKSFFKWLCSTSPGGKHSSFLIFSNLKGRTQACWSNAVRHDKHLSLAPVSFSFYQLWLPQEAREGCKKSLQIKIPPRALLKCSVVNRPLLCESFHLTLPLNSTKTQWNFITPLFNSDLLGHASKLKVSLNRFTTLLQTLLLPKLKWPDSTIFLFAVKNEIIKTRVLVVFNLLIIKKNSRFLLVFRKISNEY